MQKHPMATLGQGQRRINDLMVKGSLLISKIQKQHFSSKNKASIIVSPLWAHLLTTFLLLSNNFLVLFYPTPLSHWHNPVQIAFISLLP